ncbi:hypothetical protein GQ43DRAFT_215654 [Delitschia confertaspora ATCC 74209]|uniref:Uncharacterized protein n=1 Tax=Delitschia confertaspora ATCC 74209 TaxID=1513339 RepID=A0A9P4MUR3_9PLEO|nr:hypothetical protein GQ43DRAFT_215654 [Delitschia confertaspora ATCC 74209]
MRSLYHAAILSLPFFGVVLAQNAPSPTNEDDKQGFQDLLNALPEESLHAALHGHIPTFQDGIFESSRHGVKRVHDKNPGLATRLIVAAVQDLRKRQAPETNGTTSADTPSSQTPTQLPPSTPASTPTSIPASSPAQSSAPPASNTPVATPSESRTQNPPPSSSTPVDSSSEDEKPTPTPEPTPETTVEVPVTITSEGKTITSAQTVPAVIRTTTDSAGKSITTTSAVTETPAPTTKEVRTTTNSKGSTFVTTVTPGGGKDDSKA